MAQKRKVFTPQTEVESEMPSEKQANADENSDPSGSDGGLYLRLAVECLERCEQVSSLSETAGAITRRYLCSPMKQVHQQIGTWMRSLGMTVRVDDAGNLIGRRRGHGKELPVLLIGSHLDTVPDGGRYDGLLRCLIALSVVQALGERSLPFDLDVIGFSEEEGVRFSQPYLGSRPIVGSFDDSWLRRVDDDGKSMDQVIREFGLIPEQIPKAAYSTARVAGFIEPHIEQGPVLAQSGRPVAVVDAIVGQSRLLLRFNGQANHAGTTPMSMRRDALVTAARWVAEVSTFGKSMNDLRATVGLINSTPNARNVIPGCVEVSLDVRHAFDSIRTKATEELCRLAQKYADEDGIEFTIVDHQTQPAVAMNPALVQGMIDSVARCGIEPLVVPSGAGHDAVAMAERFPTVMLFIRQENPLSHHPDEAVAVQDVAEGIRVLQVFVRRFQPPVPVESVTSDQHL